MTEAVDPCCLSNPNEVLVKHWHWSAEPSFSNKTISATIDLQTYVLKDNVEKLVNEILFHYICIVKKIYLYIYIYIYICIYI